MRSDLNGKNMNRWSSAAWRKKLDRQEILAVGLSILERFARRGDSVANTIRNGEDGHMAAQPTHHKIIGKEN
jgi:hypothetical protein